MVLAGVIQGLGIGFLFVPLSTIAFSTLAPRLRNEGTAMFSLIRNIGSSIGISLVVTVLSRETQASHAGIGSQLSRFREALRPDRFGAIWDWTTPEGAAALNAEVTRQAQMIAYLNDFRFMLILTLAATPLILLLRAPPGPGIHPPANKLRDGERSARA
jgi:DHA2 family multidrug resistance protein